MKPAKAKSVIQIWLGGGPSHLDTFDPKPEAGSDYCGPLKNPIATNVPGIRISELLPLMAKQADKYSHHPQLHPSATAATRRPLTPSRPATCPRAIWCIRRSAAVVSLKKGYDAGYQGNLPPYITLTNPVGWFSETGFLGPEVQDLRHRRRSQRPGRSAVKDITPARRRDRTSGCKERRTLLQSIDSLAKQDGQGIGLPDGRRAGREGLRHDPGRREEGVRLVAGEERTARKYGRNCISASAACWPGGWCENGVPFITINHRRLGHAHTTISRP